MTISKLHPTFTFDADRLAALRALAPEAVADGQIHWDTLKEALGEHIEDDEAAAEHFGLVWPGKRAARRLAAQPSSRALVPAPGEGVNEDATHNLFIEGDNLEVLKLLQKSYLGKVKMIYIDPPYNTGNDFIYPDNYTESLQTYMEYTGQVDSEGKKFGTNTDADGRFHSKWLNMMYPRLYLARNLLREDGLIFISIDDGEAPNLHKLCNEVFGEENFIVTLIWKSRQIVDSRNKNNASNDHEYVLVYSRSPLDGQLQGKKIDLSKYSNPDGDIRGPWMSNSILGLANASQRPNLHYTIEDSKTSWVFECPADSGWRYSRETMAAKIADERIVFPKSPDGRPREKKFLSELQSRFTGFSSVLGEEAGYTLNGSREVRDLLEGRFFDFPKPKSLLSVLCQQGAKGPEDIILDFFAGCGTTAHAVLDMNKQDSGNRKFILIQLPEPTEHEDYPTITYICKERVRRVIMKLNDEDKAKLDLNNASKQDRGFRVFKLAESNFTPWNAEVPHDAPALERQLELHVDHLIEGRTADDILYEILLKSGFPLTTPVETLTLAGKSVYSVAGGTLFICLERALTLEVIRAMADQKPERVVCLDEGFAGNDQLKANAVQIFKTKGVTSFKTV
jgi:adenine-specific DNA-methyltransferase